MFVLHKEMERLDISPSTVRRLYRSLGDLQIALPGFPGQQATAYLCVFAVEGGFRVAVALHLLVSHRLAFYLDEQGPVRKQDVGRVLNEGIFFAESMGFMLGDLDFQLLDPTERAALWDSLPLQRGGHEALAVASPAEVTEEPLAPPVPAGEPKTGRSLRPSAFIRKRPPTAEELAAKRKKLLENLGRFLASF